MKKQTKNVITREFVEKELRFYNRADIRANIHLLGVCSVAFLPFTLLIIYGVLSEFEGVLLQIILSVFLGGIISSPIWVTLILLVRALLERKMLLRGEFDIVTRELLYKREKMVHRHIEECLKFEGFKEIAVTPTAYELASAGDAFYIVHYKAKKRIKLLYSARAYDYQ